MTNKLIIHNTNYRYSRSGVGNLRPVGRMRPAGTFDAARGIF